MQLSNIFFALVALVLALHSQSANGNALRLSETSRLGAACCDDSCKIAICVPPWTSVCLSCAKASMERVEIKQEEAVDIEAPKPDPKPQDCCQNKCKSAICVPPFVAICTGCHSSFESVLMTPPVDEVAKDTQTKDVEVPYKNCCDTSCKTQICVPPFVAICGGCKKMDKDNKVEVA